MWCVHSCLNFAYTFQLHLHWECQGIWQQIYWWILDHMVGIQAFVGIDDEFNSFHIYAIHRWIITLICLETSFYIAFFSLNLVSSTYKCSWLCLHQPLHNFVWISPLYISQSECGAFKLSTIFFKCWPSNLLSSIASDIEQIWWDYTQRNGEVYNWIQW